MQIAMQIKCVGFAVVSGLVFAFSLTSVAAIPLELALQTCQKRVEAELPGHEVELEAGATLSSGTVVIQWQTAGIRGSCRVAIDDGTVVEFVNPYGVPRGQRPIENIAAFQTEEYTVRILRLSEQLYMNIYNRKTDRVELNQGLIRATNSEEGTIYTNLLGLRRYRSIVAADGTYRLMISWGDQVVVYDQAGEAVQDSEAISPPSASSSSSSSAPVSAPATQD